MDGDDDLVLEKYMAEYERVKVRPTCFRCGSREYFEVPAEQVARLGGLGTVIPVLERARNDRGHREDMGVLRLRKVHALMLILGRQKRSFGSLLGIDLFHGEMFNHLFQVSQRRTST